MLRWSNVCMRGPRAPNKWGGKPRASRRAWRRPTSLSSLSLSAALVAAPEGPPVADGGATVKEKTELYI